MMLNDWQAVQEGGFFQAYNGVVWTAISLQAFGGLVIAAVIKWVHSGRQTVLSFNTVCSAVPP